MLPGSRLGQPPGSSTPSRSSTTRSACSSIIGSWVATTAVAPSDRTTSDGTRVTGLGSPAGSSAARLGRSALGAGPRGGRLPSCGRGMRSGPHQGNTARDRRRTGRLDAPRAVRRRRLANELAKAIAERAEALEPDGEADLRHGQVCRPEQGFCPLDPAARQVGPRRLAVRGPERASKVEPGVAGGPSHRVEVDRQRELTVDEVMGAAKRRQQLEGHTRHVASIGERSPVTCSPHALRAMSAVRHPRVHPTQRFRGGVSRA